ncbi:PREDICTED: protein HESO1-like [Camelina sativa]|uniref:Protein HESO1-like n=1 Tax=Camelina sativa TaxID=90675 RepID=A0ABM0Z1V3_CAMSA|nr:PREDICTED: protein HESO1-like [Camelina sativa]
MSRKPTILDLTLDEIITKIRPTQEDWDARIGAIKQLSCFLESVECLRGATVQPYGSFVSNIFTQSGDLDISLDIFSSSSVTKKGKQELLLPLYQKLQQYVKAGLCRDLEFVPNARVPIVKFLNVIHNIPCDISIDSLQGLLRSRFFFWISDVDQRFRYLVLLVKQWAKAHNINDAKSGTFNSHSLCWLVIFHLQTCEPAILPPLNMIYPKTATDDLTGVPKTAEERIAQDDAARLEIKSFTEKSANQSSFSELLVTFFQKFSDINVRAEQYAVCPYTGTWESRSSNTSWKAKKYSLFVEDPFEQQENITRSVQGIHLDRIAQEFEKAWRCLASESDRTSIIRVLTEEHTQQSLLDQPQGSLRATEQVQQSYTTPYWTQPTQSLPQQNWSPTSDPWSQQVHQSYYTTPNWTQPTQSLPQQNWSPTSDPWSQQVHQSYYTTPNWTQPTQSLPQQNWSPTSDPWSQQVHQSYYTTPNWTQPTQSLPQQNWSPTSDPWSQQVHQSYYTTPNWTQPTQSLPQQNWSPTSDPWSQQVHQSYYTTPNWTQPTQSLPQPNWSHTSEPLNQQVHQSYYTTPNWTQPTQSLPQPNWSHTSEPLNQQVHQSYYTTPNWTQPTQSLPQPNWSHTSEPLNQQVHQSYYTTPYWTQPTQSRPQQNWSTSDLWNQQRD